MRKQAIGIIKKDAYSVTGSFITGAVLLFFAKDLLFFDEDVFVTNLHSAFMQQNWQRSYLVKQFLKAQHFLFGNNPAGYHIVSICLHFICAVTGLQLFKKILTAFSTPAEPLYSPAAPLLFYAFFLITPVHGEPLCYILAQGVMVFTFFSLLSVLFFIKAVTEKNSFILLSLSAFACALLCYEISWMLPFIQLCILVFLRKTNTVPVAKTKWMLAVPGFALLAAWLYIKTVYISASLVADYGSITLGTADPVLLARNSLLLFLRNFLPPFKNTVYFVVMAVALITALLTGALLLLRNKNKNTGLLILLVVITVLSFAPASFLGIDSHDSESERYVYFSSVFAMMLPAVMLPALVKNTAVHKTIIAVIIILYSGTLFNTINKYRQGGRFSKQYLDAVSEFTRDKKTVYTINQPSQFYGALLVRALTRLPVTSNGHYTVLNEYMKYLYQNDSTVYITVSVKEPEKLPAKLNVLVLDADSTIAYFPEMKGMIYERFQKNAVAVAALRNDSLFVFR